MIEEKIHKKIVNNNKQMELFYSKTFPRKFLHFLPLYFPLQHVQIITSPCGLCAQFFFFFNILNIYNLHTRPLQKQL